MKKYLIIIQLLLFGAIACQNSNTESKSEEKASSSSDISTTSIFQLKSTWENQDGGKIHLKDLKGKVTVLVMIYTTCKSACPILVADMHDLHDKVPAKYNQEVQYVLVTIDPKNDSAKRLKEFSIQKNMDTPEWMFLRGTEDDTQELANVLAVKYKEISPMDFSHSNIISVFDKNGELVHQMEGLSVNNEATQQSILNAINL